MLKQIFTISEYPEFSLLPKAPFSDRLATLLKTYGLIFVAIILVAPLILATDQFITHVLHFKTIYYIQKDTMSRFFHRYGYWKAAFYVCLLGPLLEETIFRLPLSLKKNHIALSFSVAVFLFGGVFFAGIKNPLINLAIRLPLSAIIYFACYRLVPNRLSIIDHRFRKQLIILSICLFGLMHISNYSPIQWPIIILYPMYVLPQVFMGWGISFMRFKYGFWCGFALHCLINSVAVAFAFGHY